MDCDLCKEQEAIRAFAKILEKKFRGWGYIESYCDEAIDKLEELAHVLVHECDEPTPDPTP